MGDPAATMYVGYVLDKESPVYPGPARPASLGLGPQTYGPPGPPPTPSQYPDFTGYSHVEPAPTPSTAWGAPFTAPKDDWVSTYGSGPTVPAANSAPLAFGPPPDFSPVPVPPGPGAGLLAQHLGSPGGPSSPGAQRRTPYEWMRRSVAAGGGGGSGKDPSWRLRPSRASTSPGTGRCPYRLGHLLDGPCPCSAFQSVPPDPSHSWAASFQGPSQPSPNQGIRKHKLTLSP